MALREAEEAALDHFLEARVGRHFSFKSPYTGVTVYATFMRAPFVGLAQIVVGSDPTYEVELVLHDTTNLTEPALEHGVASSTQRPPVTVLTGFGVCSRLVAHR